MPLYAFECNKCTKRFKALSPFDPKGKYSKVKCPECGSKKKTKLLSMFSISGGDTKMFNFGYRAGKNMEKAKAERRAAEAASHLGSTPISNLDDTSLGEGIHDNDGPIVL